MERKRPLLVALAGAVILVALVGIVVVLRGPSCALVETLRLDSAVVGCGNPQARAALAAGRASMAQRSLREALAQFRSAATLAPSLTSAHLARGEAAEALGEFDEALAAYTRAARLAPSTETNFKLGLMADEMGDAELAV